MSEVIEKTKIQIKSIFGKVLFESEKTTIKEVAEGADLEGADLRGADLGGANLEGADLRSADLGGANLEGADLEGADLGGANLGGANLRGANLRGANLRGADLGGADGLVSITTDSWTIYVQKEVVTIGCQHHSYTSWIEFSDGLIERMHDNAPDFWKKYKPLVIAAHQSLNQ